MKIVGKSKQLVFLFVFFTFAYEYNLSTQDLVFVGCLLLRICILLVLHTHLVGMFPSFG